MLRNVSRPASVAEEDDTVGITLSSSGILVTPSKLERKPSRTPSIRATPSSHLERKQSTIRSRRSSLPSISQRASMAVAETSEEPPLRALVSSGSLERLVDVLVSGLEEVGMQTSPADDNGETSLREGRTRGIRVDHAEYCKIFWGAFRSFVTPMVLFEVSLLDLHWLTSRLMRRFGIVDDSETVPECGESEIICTHVDFCSVLVPYECRRGAE